MIEKEPNLKNALKVSRKLTLESFKLKFPAKIKKHGCKNHQIYFVKMIGSISRAEVGSQLNFTRVICISFIAYYFNYFGFL